MVRSHRRRWPGYAAALVVTLASATGCNVWTTSTEGVDRVIYTSDDPRIAVHDLGDGGMDALLTGTLWYDPESRCLFVRQDGHDDREVLVGVVWPRGTRPVIVHDGVRGVDVPRVGLIRTGDRVDFAGGYVSSGRFEVPEGCATEEIFVVTP